MGVEDGRFFFLDEIFFLEFYGLFFREMFSIQYSIKVKIKAMSNKSEAEKGPESPKWLKKKKNDSYQLIVQISVYSNTKGV